MAFFKKIKHFAALVRIALCQETSHELMVGQKMNFFFEMRESELMTHVVGD